MIDMYGQQGMAEGEENKYGSQENWDSLRKDIRSQYPYKKGTTVTVPHKGKLVNGKIVRYEVGGGGYSPAYVVDIGEYESIMVEPNKVRQGVAEADMNRRGFLKGIGAAMAGAAGIGAASNSQARATPEWMEKVGKAKELLAKGLTPEQIAKKLGVTGPNNNIPGPMGGDWGAINYAVQQTQRTGIKEGKRNLKCVCKTHGTMQCPVHTPKDIEVIENNKKA
jgi:hypothetical protein